MFSNGARFFLCICSQGKFHDCKCCTINAYSCLLKKVFLWGNALSHSCHMSTEILFLQTTMGTMQTNGFIHRCMCYTGGVFFWNLSWFAWVFFLLCISTAPCFTSLLMFIICHILQIFKYLFQPPYGTEYFLGTDSLIHFYIEHLGHNRCFLDMSWIKITD